MYRFLQLIVILCFLQLRIRSLNAATTLLLKPRVFNEGKYVPDTDKWAYKPDNRGKYVHVHIPYNGGYGPFMNPYDHIDNPYDHIDNKYIDDPFKNNFFNDPRPAVYREYGAPLFNAA